MSVKPKPIAIGAKPAGARRSVAPKIIAETAALSQLWLFWVAPILGAVIGAIIYKVVAGDKNVYRHFLLLKAQK
jgi:hypothetical protein